MTVTARVQALRDAKTTAPKTSTSTSSPRQNSSSTTTSAPASTSTPLYKPGTTVQVYNAQTGAVIPGATSSFSGTTSTPTGGGISYS